jgi:catechol 2,3-dioxygenase-like lactoylglutathione lyase family enzyme
MIKKVKFLGIPVINQDRALAFYTEKLGFSVLTDQEFDGKQRWIELKVPGAETGVVLFTPDGHENRVGTFVNTALEADSVERTFHDLKEKGVEFMGTPKKEEWGSFVIMKDSEGNMLCLSGK